MEEEKAAAYYDELSRSGSATARFKQGLGFSSSHPPPPIPSSVPSSSSSFLTQFVKASNSTSSVNPESDKDNQKSQIQNKLRKKESSSIERDGERHSHKVRSRSRTHSILDRDRRSSRRSRSRSFSDEERKRKRERRKRTRTRSRSPSPRYERSDNGRRSVKENKGAIDYSNLIKGYGDMTPAERVKAKMKLQLSETAAKDTKIGTGSGWERFDFDKDAPLDDEDEEIVGANDDAKVVKHLGQSFRFSNVQARREEQIQAAHDEAMFGAPTRSPSVPLDSAEETVNKPRQIESIELAATGLFNDEFLSKKQGSWRDRAPRKIN